MTHDEYDDPYNLRFKTGFALHYVARMGRGNAGICSRIATYPSKNQDSGAGLFIRFDWISSIVIKLTSLWLTGACHGGSPDVAFCNIK